jgi:hypothetical protein
LIDALIVAGGGGSGGFCYFGGTASEGGYGGFYEGGDSLPGSRPQGGYGATQTAGGIANPVYGTGFPGTFGQGGNAGDTGSFFAGPGGGGGGGWYGGGGANSAIGNGGGAEGGGGGGGSGYVNASAYDLEITDNENGDNGYMIISWDTPEGE